MLIKKFGYNFNHYNLSERFLFMPFVGNIGRPKVTYHQGLIMVKGQILLIKKLIIQKY